MMTTDQRAELDAAYAKSAKMPVIITGPHALEWTAVLLNAWPDITATIDAQAAEIARLREALRPFADMLDALENLGGMAKTGAWYIAESSVSGPREITFEHFHAARAALTANHSAPQEQQP